MSSGADGLEGTVRVIAPAKINLYLGVHDEKDAEGYHRVDTVMAALELADTVDIEVREDGEGTGPSVETVPELDIPMEQNTAYKAAVRLGEALGRSPDVRISIRKRIPVCAGLGGPSSDAAAVLVGLCEMWGVDAADPRVEDVARSVGADVAFFLHDSPAYLSGRGDVLQEVLPALDSMPVVLVKPFEGGLSTAEAYRRFDEDPAEPAKLEPMLDALRAGRSRDVPGLVANNLVWTSCSLEPRIAQVLDWLRRQPGVLAADMCGSGACSYAICESEEAAGRLAGAASVSREARAAGGWWSRATRMENYGARTFGE